MSIVLWHQAPVGPCPVRTVYTKSRLSREQVVSRNTGFLDGLPTLITVLTVTVREVLQIAISSYLLLLTYQLRVFRNAHVKNLRVKFSDFYKKSRGVRSGFL